MHPMLEAVRVGQPRTIAGADPWLTAFYKEPIAGPVHLGPENLHGDRQADLSVHGGPDKAVLAYAVDHYDDWRRELQRPDAQPGWFGENFCVRGQTEQTVAIGDVFRIGEAIVQVAQPRGPCWKLGRRWDRPDLPKLVLESGRSGWYLRVLQTGDVAAGDPCVLLERVDPRWTIAEVNRVTYARGRAALLLRDVRRALAACVALAPNWRAALSSPPDAAP